MGIRDEQKKQRQNDILIAALKLFTRRGYSATKIKDIADEVGMSVGLLFHYFESKEKLYEQLIQVGVAFPAELTEESTSDPLKYFQNIVDQVFNLLKSEPIAADIFVLMNQAQYNEAAPEGVKETLMNFDVVTPALDQMKKGQQMGVIREGDPMALVTAFLCAIEGIAEQIALTPDTPCPQSEWIMDMIKKK